MGNFGENLYSGAAGFGRIEANIGLIVAVIVGLILTVIGVFLLFSKAKHTTRITGTVEGNSSCSRDIANNSTGNWNCSIIVTYTVNGQIYSKNFTIDSHIQYQAGQTIDVYYDPSNPGDSMTSKDSPKTIGVIFISIAVAIVGLAWLSVWIARKSKFGAAVEGTSSAVSILTHK